MQLARGWFGSEVPMVPMSFSPCFAPLGRVACGGTPSGRLLTEVGMSYITQWTKLSASGSKHTSTKLRVPLGAPDQLSGGDTFCPPASVEAYLSGSVPLLAKAVLERLRLP